MKKFRSTISIIIAAVILCASLTVGLTVLNNQPNYTENLPVQQNVQVVSPDNTPAVDAPSVVADENKKSEDKASSENSLSETEKLPEQTEPVTSVDENGNTVYYVETKPVYLDDYYSNEIQSNIISNTDNSYYYNAGSYKFYDCLSNEAKEIYDAFISALKSDITATSISYTPEATISGSTMSEMQTEVSTFIVNNVAPVVFAISRDYPEYFFVYGYSVGYSYYSDPYEVASFTIYITYFSYKINPNTSNEQVITPYTTANVASYYNDLMSAVNNLKVTGLNRFEKLKSIHDSLAALVTYDPNYDNMATCDPYSHQPTGALICNHIAVCEGYAESFKLICDREGIPCVIATGDNHMWNYVQMEDGNWYMVDVTWDDQDTSTYYTYFLVGLGTSVSPFSYTSCAGGHTEELSFGTLDLSSMLSYPTLHTGDYANMYLKTSTGKVSVDETNRKIYLMPGGTTANLLVKSDVGTITRGGNKTGDTLTFTSKSGVSTTYKVIMYGDVNCDGTATTADYTMLKKAAAGSVSLATYPLDAGDINRDGAVDAFDAFQLEMYLSGRKNYFEVA